MKPYPSSNQAPGPLVVSTNLATMENIDPNAVDITATHALRNPLKEVIPPKQNPKKTTAPGEDPAAIKNATKLRRQETRKAALQLNDALSELLGKTKDALRVIAEEHGRKFEYVEKMYLRKTFYGKKRRPNLQNALCSRSCPWPKIHAQSRKTRTSKPSKTIAP